MPPPHSRAKGTPAKPLSLPVPVPLPVPGGFLSKSTPNLPTLRSRAGEQNSSRPAQNATPAGALPADITVSPDTSGDNGTSPSEPASIDDFSLDSAPEPPSPPPPPGSSDEDSAGGGGGRVPNLPTRPIYHQYSRSYTHLAPSSFAPPFYNRPPTPLPPSPSLTSLLRPLTAQNSRPTTPDPSSDEGAPHPRAGDAAGAQTPSSAAASALTSTFPAAKPIPRASPRVPTYEYYGFTLYLTSSLAFIVYLLWSFLPSPFLHQLGIYYYPNRWWALAIPAWTVMLVVYIYVALACYNVAYLTLPLTSVECVVDEAAHVAVVDSNGKILRNERASWTAGIADASRPNATHGPKSGLGKKAGARAKTAHSRQPSLTKPHPLNPELDWRSLWNEGTDAVMDIPIGGVCEILYGADDSPHQHEHAD